MGADIKKDGNRIICRPVKELYAKEITVPGDISSAAYFIVAGLIVPNSEIILKNVGDSITIDYIKANVSTDETTLYKTKTIK